MNATTEPSHRPVRLLSLDGGGVRGLSELVLLEQIMDNINTHRIENGLAPQEPWETFDMIGGTSTGGLIAIMLGRLRMPLNKAIEAYMELSESAFTEKNFAKRAMGGPLGAKFQTEALEDAIKTIIGKECETMLLKDADECRTFVVTHRTNLNDAEILRSYRNKKKALASLNSMLVWKAARATSAALSYFDPIDINGVVYRDGGLMYNNPVEKIHSEASVVFPDRPQIIVSLGTGLASTKPFTGRLAAITQELADIATEAETVSNDFYEREDSLAAKSGLYFRFNVPEIGDQGLAESKLKDLTHIRIMTEKYINNPKTGFELASCTEKLTEAPRTLSVEERWEELKR